MSTHLSWETVNDLVDGLLPDAGAAEADEHVRHCTTCAATLAGVRATVRAATELPDNVGPPPDLWSEVRATIEARKIAHLPHRPGAGGRGWWITPGRLVAAAVLLVAATATLTGITMSARQRTLARLDDPVAVSVSWQASEREFLTSVLELREQMATLHDHVSPETVTKVEHALSTIDLAIAEARAALVQDPANAALSEILASNYRQKIDLLRRATQLASST